MSVLLLLLVSVMNVIAQRTSCTEAPAASDPACVWDFVELFDDVHTPPTPVVNMEWVPESKDFHFDATTWFTRDQTTYIININPLDLTRNISEVDKCENRDGDLFGPNDNPEAWWCSPSDATGIGSSQYLAWGPSGSWNQSAVGCDKVKYERDFSITELSSVTDGCLSAPGVVTASTQGDYLVYDGILYISLVDDDSEWKPATFHSLIRWEFPWQFSFNRNFQVVTSLIMTRTGVDVKIGVHIEGRKLVITVITRVHPEVYGNEAYIRWKGTTSFHENVTMPNTNPPTNEYQGDRTIGGQDAPCVLPVCEQVWTVTQINELPLGQNFGGRYESDFEVARTPGSSEDPFKVSITIDDTYKPEETIKIENITLDSTVQVYDDNQFSNLKTGYINRETLYVSHAIELATDDLNIWDLNLEDVKLCSVPNDTPLSSGCSNSLALHHFWENSTPRPTEAAQFQLVEYAPGQVPNRAYSSITGFSFHTDPLYTDRVDTQRTFHMVIYSRASLKTVKRALALPDSEASIISNYDYDSEKRAFDDVPQTNKELQHIVQFTLDNEGNVIGTQTTTQEKEIKDMLSGNTFYVFLAGIAGLTLIVLAVIIGVVVFKLRSADDNNPHVLVAATDSSDDSSILSL